MRWLLLFLCTSCGMQDPTVFRVQDGPFGIHVIGGGGTTSSSWGSSAFDSTYLSLQGSTPGNLGGASHSPLANNAFGLLWGPYLIPSVGQFGVANLSASGAPPAKDAEWNHYVAYLGKLSGATLVSPSQSPTFNFGIAKLDRNGALQWATEFGDPNSTSMMATKVLVDSSGGVYFLGSASSPAVSLDFGFSQVGVAGKTHCLVVRLNSSTGALAWGKQFSPGGGGAACLLGDGFIDNQGNLIVAGGANTSLGGTLTYGSGGAMDFVASLQPATGNINWFSEQSGISNVTAGMPLLAQGSDGSIYVSGGAGNTSVAALGGASVVGSDAAAAQEGVVYKLDSSGNRQWIFLLGGGAGTTTALQGQTPLLEGDSVWFTGGSTGNLGGTQIGTHGPFDAFVLRASTSGSLAFVTQIGNGTGVVGIRPHLGIDSSTTVAVGDIDGAIPGFTTSGVITGSSMYGVRLNPTTGALLDGLNLGTGGTITMNSSTRSGSTLYACGSVEGTFSNATRIGTAGTTDAFALKWNASASQPTWITQIGASGASVRCRTLNLKPTGTLVLGGTTTNSLGGTVHNALGNTGFFALQLNSNGQLH